MGATLQGVGIESGLWSNQFYTNLGSTYSQSDRLSRTTANFVVSPNQINNINIFLFSKNGNGVSYGAGSCRIYSAKFYDDGTPVRAFIPCYNKNLNELGEEFGYGLYDTVEGVFYGNSGTGKFYGKSFLEEGETCKIFDRQQYLVDHEMVNDISTTTITGTGTEIEPYILNSTEDFWWIMQYVLVEQKYIEIACDIVLNEEKFDADGNVIEGSSQDGRVYNWWGGDRIGTFEMTVDGKEHCISGAYIYCADNTSRIALFSWAKDLRNIILENIYVNIDQGSGLCTLSNSIENCHIRSGLIRTRRSDARPFTYSGCKIIKNCSNYADVVADTGARGIGDAEIIENCVNYGNISGRNSAGIGNGKIVRKCVNYGNIYQGDFSGGISSDFHYNNYGTISNCKNYGELSGRCGGIVGWVSTKCHIENCENHGAINIVGGSVNGNDYYSGQIISRAGSMSAGSDETCVVSVSNCKAVSSKGNYKIVGQIFNHLDLVMNDCEFTIDNYFYSNHFIAFYNTKGKSRMSNIKFNVRSKNQSDIFVLARGGNFELTNIYVQTNFTLSDPRLFRDLQANAKCDGIVMLSPLQKLYYGTNFSGFNVSWRTGAINLNSMSSQGSFAPRLTEDMLVEMGYTKKTM